MIFIRFTLVVAIFCSNWALAQTFDEPATGDEIAKELCSMQPTANSEISGILRIRSKEQRHDIPIVCNVVTNGDSWKVIYETSATTMKGAEKLIVLRSLEAPNKYFYARAASPEASLPKPRLLAASEAAISLAGSDFWLTELGFEFLHWPRQEKLKGEMRLGQACYVLQSINPEAPKAVRVKSWIDKDSGGLLIADAFDRNNKLIKEFSLSGSSFKKVNGQWQLRKMRIRSPRSNSETVIEFDLPEG